MALSTKDTAAFLSSNTQADAARIVGMDGKSFRNITRSAFGVYVSRGGSWDERTRAFRLAYHNAPDADTRKSIVTSYKNGDDVPPVK